MLQKQLFGNVRLENLAETIHPTRYLISLVPDA